MSRRRPPSDPTRGLPPLLLRVIHAASLTDTNADNRNREGAALAAFGQWALVAVPSTGVLVPVTSEAFDRIEAIARQHLQFGPAVRSFRNALRAVEDAATFDAIESAENRLRSISDAAYYYTGLTCGITLAQLASGDCQCRNSR